MCSPMFGLAGMAAGGSRTGLALLSPAAAAGSALFGKKRPADRQGILYPNDRQGG